MKKILSAAAITGMIVAASPALSGGSGTMDLMPSGEWAKVVPDKELAETRGGFFSLAFSAMLTIFAENGTATTGGVVNATAAAPPIIPPAIQLGIQNDQFQVSAFVGSFQNVNGILNVIQVPGSFNVVNSYLSVQFTIINVLNGAQIPALSSLLQNR